MKRIVLFAGVAFFLGLNFHAAEACKPKELGNVGTHAAVVNTATLHGLFVSKMEMVLIDARTGDCISGKRIPGGKYLNASSTSDEITAVIPKKDTLVVIYSTDSECEPNNQLCAKKLVELGYTNLLVYTAGFSIWEKSGYPVELDAQTPAKKDEEPVKK